jgi:hypothetical protein
VLRDNARGIGFGLATSGEARTYADNPCPIADGGYVDHYGGIIRNNFVSAGNAALFASDFGFDCGICLWQACDADVVHNTVASTQAPFSSIEWRFDYTDADIINNLVTHNLRDRGGITRLSGNLAYQPMSLFVNGPGGDLHLVSGARVAIDRGVVVSAGLCDDDIDGESRPINLIRDIGADEYVLPAPDPVHDLRVPRAVAGSDSLTITLAWTNPSTAVTSTLRFDDRFITHGTWPTSSFLSRLPGSTDSFTVTLPYDGTTLYFALRLQNAEGVWSALSNNAFWPYWDVLLPVIYEHR